MSLLKNVTVCSSPEPFLQIMHFTRTLAGGNTPSQKRKLLSCGPLSPQVAGVYGHHGLPAPAGCCSPSFLRTMPVGAVPLPIGNAYALWREDVCYDPLVRFVLVFGCCFAFFFPANSGPWPKSIGFWAGQPLGLRGAWLRN